MRHRTSVSDTDPFSVRVLVAATEIFKTLVGNVYPGSMRSLGVRGHGQSVPNQHIKWTTPGWTSDFYRVRSARSCGPALASREQGPFGNIFESQRAPRNSIANGLRWSTPTPTPRCRCKTRCGDSMHCLDEFSARICGGWRRATLVEATAILEPAVGIIAKEIRRANRAIGPCRRLRLVVKIWKWELVRLRKSFHIVKGVSGIGRAVIRANGRKADAFCH
jgi:hypothetical protein